VRSGEGVSIDGYDLRAEDARLAFPDVVVAGRRLNRGTARVSPEGTPHERGEAVRAAHEARIMPSTLGPDSPVIDLSWPATGLFVASPAGTYLDLYQGVAQKLLDEHHPALQGAARALTAAGLLLRREINTDDFLALGTPLPGVRLPQELAELACGLVERAFPSMGRTRLFFSNSGAEAGEAAIKLAQLHAYRRCLRRHGAATWERLMLDLGIPRVTDFDADPGGPDEPLWQDHPLFLFGCEGAFHGRTLGVLNLTWSRKAHHIGYGKLRWVKHLPFNGRVSDLTDRLDTRPLPALLDAPGGVREVLAAGRVPVDLCALLAVECVQGEGGYRLADRAWLDALAEACREHGILLGVDEVQTLARTGELFGAEHYGVTPDILWTSKAAVVGMTVAREELVRDTHVGWHSNTFGGGKLFDVNLAHAVLDTVANARDPLFDGRGYLENSRIKGEYVRLRLADLSARHPEAFPDFSGLGGMWGLTVRWRDEVIRTGWRLGAKLLGCGRKGELSRLRVVLPVDVLTREVDEMIDVLDRVFGAVERAHEEG
jgi:4-aminobutyrate aminotransferase-like enzyme